jgi:hypothetical protein
MGQREKVIGEEDNYKVRKFIICTFHLISVLLVWWIQAGWNRWKILHAYIQNFSPILRKRHAQMIGYVQYENQGTVCPDAQWINLSQDTSRCGQFWGRQWIFWRKQQHAYWHEDYKNNLLFGNLKRGHHINHPAVDKPIILTWILNK